MKCGHVGSGYCPHGIAENHRGQDERCQSCDLVAKETLYVVVSVDDYVPHVPEATMDRTKALNTARTIAKGWQNEQTEEHGEIYFNQKEDGNMENAVSVQEVTIT